MLVLFERASKMLKNDLCIKIRQAVLEIWSSKGQISEEKKHENIVFFNVGIKNGKQ